MSLALTVIAVVGLTLFLATDDEEDSDAAMARARSRDGVGGLLEFVIAERTRPPFGRVGLIDFGDVVVAGWAGDDDIDDDDEDSAVGEAGEFEDDGAAGAGGGGKAAFNRLPGMSCLILSGMLSIS